MLLSHIPQGHQTVPYYQPQMKALVSPQWCLRNIVYQVEVQVPLQIFLSQAVIQNTVCFYTFHQCNRPQHFPMTCNISYMHIAILCVCVCVRVQNTNQK